MKCSDCGNWVQQRFNLYTDGTQIVTFSAPEGKGHCEILKVETAPDFGCTSFVAGSHTAVVAKDGAPWQNWHMGKCPECDGRGSHLVELRPACRRCAGLGKVRHYDDGYVADASWDHPKEKELKKQAGEAAKLDPGLILAQTDKKNDGIFE